MISWHPFSNPYSIALFENDSSQIRIIRMFDLEESTIKNFFYLNFIFFWQVRLLDLGISKKCTQIEWNPKNHSYVIKNIKENSI